MDELRIKYALCVSLLFYVFNKADMNRKGKMFIGISFLKVLSRSIKKDFSVNFQEMFLGENLVGGNN